MLRGQAAGGVDANFTEFLRPILSYLKETEGGLDFEATYQNQYHLTCKLKSLFF